MTRQPNNLIYKMVVTIWLTLSIGSVVLVAVTWAQLSARMAEAREIATTRETLAKILKSLLDAETGARGYIITGDKVYLQPFNASATNLPPEFDQLVELANGDDVLLKQVSDLRAEAELVVNWQREAVIARDHGFGRATDIFPNYQGKNLTDEARREIAGMDKTCRAQQSAVRKQIDARLSRANFTSLVAGILGVSAGIFAFWISRLTLKHQQRERELVEAKLQAEHSNQEKTVFLANMSHEIRTPMNAILGFSELLQRDLREPQHRQYLQLIRSSASSLLLLINDILDMSKIESGVMRLHPEPTDLREICDFVQTLFSEPANKKQLKLECSVLGNFPHAILIDRIRLRQILVNLVGNAVKFTDHGGIEVRVLCEKQEMNNHITLVIEVQDTGVGIPQDMLDAIFKPFVQAGAFRDKEKQGTGLGLSIVKRLTEIMGGTVTVASVMNQGSAFHLRFPNVMVSARLPASEKNADVSEVDFNGLRAASLLVVDDNETNCQLIAGMFAGSHHRLFFGASGEEAIAQCRELKPDILLLDMRMPGMGGSAALEEIRKIPGLEFLPVIAVTASQLAGEENILKEQISGYIRKPFSKRELFEELADFLPRAANAEPEDERKSGASKNPAVPAPVPKELISQLRQLLIEPWPSIRDSVAINESTKFAEGLEGLGRRWQCQPLVEYARKLLHDAETYAATDLEKHLGEFAALVEQLDQQNQA